MKTEKEKFEEECIYTEDDRKKGQMMLSYLIICLIVGCLLIWFLISLFYRQPC